MIKFLDKIEAWLGSRWQWVFYIKGQKLDFGSWKVLISIPAHLVIGFLYSLFVLAIVGHIIPLWKVIAIGASAACMLELKDIYFYTAKKDYTMFLQSVWDGFIYILGAGFIFFLI